jgi:hypothetical protein
VIAIVGLMMALLAIVSAAGSDLGGLVKSAEPSPSATTPSPSPKPSQDARLSWAPPMLSQPTVVRIGPGKRNVKLDASEDAIIVLPETRQDLGGGVTITGGHNVVMIGGEVYIGPGVSGKADRRGLYLRSQTGTVHVEGVALTGHLIDGIDFEEDQGATVQIENVFVEHCYGSYSTDHADVIQTWAGPAKLRVDGLRATTDYQGFFLLPNQHFTGAAPTEFTFRRSIVTMTSKSQYALWLPQSHGFADMSGLSLFFDGRDNPQKYIEPDPVVDHWGITLVSSPSAVSLPGGEPGTAYKSPGYR